jgi:hypothetical protein
MAWWKAMESMIADVEVVEVVDSGVVGSGADVAAVDDWAAEVVTVVAAGPAPGVQAARTIPIAMVRPRRRWRLLIGTSFARSTRRRQVVASL